MFRGIKPRDILPISDRVHTQSTSLNHDSHHPSETLKSYMMVGKVVNAAEWRKIRLELLQKEREHTQNADRLAKLRSEMPMTRVTEAYHFTGAEGNVSLEEIFQDKKQLIVYHIMFDPVWDAACKGCSFALDNYPHHLQHLENKNTRFVIIGRAPYEKIKAFKERMGWSMPCYSSYGSPFNYDFQVTHDESIMPIEYNYKSKDELEAKGLPWYVGGEQPGLSVFLVDGGEVYHTYSAYARGLDHMLTTYSLLDFTPLGRQDSESGPALPYHDTYGTTAAA